MTILSKIYVSVAWLRSKLKIQAHETFAQEALRLLSAVPEEQWVIGQWTDHHTKRCCASGHYARLKVSPDYFDFLILHGDYENEHGHHVKLLKEASFKFLKGVDNILTVNDMLTHGYKQPTSKQRVIAMLKDMVQAGY